MGAAQQPPCCSSLFFVPHGGGTALRPLLCVTAKAGETEAFYSVHPYKPTLDLLNTVIVHWRNEV